jgi:hypothetical protein
VGKEGELEGVAGGVATLTVVAVHRVTVREGVQHRTGTPQQAGAADGVAGVVCRAGVAHGPGSGRPLKV